MSGQPEWIITPQQLKSEIGQVVLVDVRQPEEYEESRIEGGILIPLGELQGRAAAELDPEANIVVYCAHGMRSLQGVMVLRGLGFKHLRSLDGGIEEWKMLG